MLTIRAEQTDDYTEVYQVITAAFQTAEYSGGNEADLVNNLRESPFLFRNYHLSRCRITALSDIFYLPKPLWAKQLF